MVSFGIRTGYLINFPKHASFPKVEGGLGFRTEVLQGVESSTRELRPRKKKVYSVQILRVEMDSVGNGYEE